jgi:hypothetical protein
MVIVTVTDRPSKSRVSQWARYSVERYQEPVMPDFLMCVCVCVCVCVCARACVFRHNADFVTHVCMDSYYEVISRIHTCLHMVTNGSVHMHRTLSTRRGPLSAASAAVWNKAHAGFKPTSLEGIFKVYYFRELLFDGVRNFVCCCYLTFLLSYTPTIIYVFTFWLHSIWVPKICASYLNMCPPKHDNAKVSYVTITTLVCFGIWKRRRTGMVP